MSEPCAGAAALHRACSVYLILERETGFEPATTTLATWNSTTELLPQKERPDFRRVRLVDLRGFEPLTF